jgi:hypothetical protein
MRGAIHPRVGLFEEAAQEIKALLHEEGVARMPVGIDVVEPGFLFALQKAGLEIRDCQQVMLDAREIKSHDEITLLNMAAAMGDGAYQDIFEGVEARRARRTKSSPWRRSVCTRWGRTASKRSTRSPASVAAPTRTISPTA